MSLKLREKLIVFALIVMPFTMLRIGPIGLGEFIFIVFILSELRNKRLNVYENNFIFSKFWVAFLSMSLVGFLCNIVFLNHRTGTYAGMAFDFTSYVLIFLSCFSLENMIKRTNLNLFKMIRVIFFWSGFLFLMLYTLSFFKNNLFGFPLNYYTYFAPLANNLHQISLFLVPLPFLGLIVFKEEKRSSMRMVILFLIGMIFVMGVSTGSLKAIIGFTFGLIMFFFLSWLYFFKERNRGVALSFIFILLITLLLYNIDSIISYGLAVIVEEDLKEGRVNLYSKAIDIMKTSPIFGVGPGGHIWTNSKFYDSHQTFFTVMLQAGIIGVYLLGKLFSKIIATLIKSPALFASLVTIIIYLLGGDIMRRLPTWIILVILFYYQKQTVFSKKETI